MTRLLANPVSIYLTVVGAVLLMIAVGLLISRLRIATGERAQGQVIGYAERLASSRGEKLHYMPIVRFQPRTGQAIEFQSAMGAYSRPFQIGQPVPVLYRPEQPQMAEIGTAARLWVAPVATALLASGALFGAWQAGTPH